MLEEIGCRYVRIASVSMDEPARMVVTHDRNGAAEVAEYLLSLGHADIALITGPRAYRSAIERTDGFLEVLQRRGIELPKARIVEAGYTFESGVAAAEQLLAGKKRPTAIFTGNDEMAAGVYKVAMRAGIHIPRELSIVGFDDSPLASRLWPALTSVRRNTRDTGRLAAAILLQPEGGAGVLAEASIRPHLIIRDSTQSPA
jgi:LacI family transcriptional regulator